MVQTNWLAPLTQIGREIRIELRMTYAESRFAALDRRLRRPGITRLPEQPRVDLGSTQRHEAETLLRAVRHGAVRR